MSKASIQSLIEQVRNETQLRGNTRERIASLLTQLNSEKLDRPAVESIISEITNISPLFFDQFGNILSSLTQGWTEQTAYEADGTRLVKKITGYTGATGTIPKMLSVNIGKYYKADGTLTTVKAEGANFRGDVGQAIINNNTYNLDPEQIVPSEALYNDTLETLAGDIIKRVDINTGENVNYRETIAWYDGSLMTDAKADGYIYKKIGDKFYKKATTSINVSDFGADITGLNDSSDAFQIAINFCNVTGNDLNIDGKILVTKTIFIDRPTDSKHFSKYLTIFNGEIEVPEGVKLFSSNLVGDASSQLVKFSGITFYGGEPDWGTRIFSQSSYVLKDSRLFRLSFIDCTFLNVKFIDADGYLQSIYLSGCQARFWGGSFWRSKFGAYDIKISQSLFEHGENAFELKGIPTKVIDFSISNSVIEGCFGYGIGYDKVFILNVDKVYFEGNVLGDVVPTNTTFTPYNNNTINVRSCLLSNTGADNTGVGYRHIILDSVMNGIIAGNSCDSENEIYYKTECGVTYIGSDLDSNKIHGAKQYFADKIPTPIDVTSVNNDYRVAKGSIIWNTEIGDNNNWIGAICTTHNVSPTQSKWIKFGSKTNKQVLKGTEDLNDIVDDGVYFTSQDFVKTHASFPTTEKGIFEKYKSQDGYENVFQRFTTNAGAIFIRTFSGYSGNWTNWGKIEKAESQINSTATDVSQLVLDFNALLTRLRNAGLLNS